MSKFKIKGSTTLYVLDMICMVASITLVAFVVYIIPHVLLGYKNYEVPGFIIQFEIYYEKQANLSGIMKSLAMLAPFVFASGAFLMISRVITFYLETHETEPGVPHIEKSEYMQHKFKREHRWGPTLLILGLMFGVILALVLAEYFLVISIF